MDPLGIISSNNWRTVGGEFSLKVNVSRSFKTVGFILILQLFPSVVSDK